MKEKKERKIEYYNEAIKEFNKAIELSPKDKDAYYERGNVKAMLMDYTGAIEDYNKALAIDSQRYIMARGLCILKKETTGVLLKILTEPYY